ncbi:MAG: hypothetical protein D3926_25360 [Desulfobacteraceae bacterium]|nr:MAG: hypothetical protein D3926_25360 [Desulfobacteraceae bacterium]
MIENHIAPIKNPMVLCHVYTKRCIRYFRVGFLLHLISIAGLALFFRVGTEGLLSVCLSVCGIGLVVFAQLDTRSRFQNYKAAKDLFYENGLKIRIVRLFTASRCQRDALSVAARDLDLSQALNDAYEELGYKWFHIIPDVVAARPKCLLARKFWKYTLFAPSYTSKYFLW